MYALAAGRLLLALDHMADRSDKAFDSLMDRWEGRPVQSAIVKVSQAQDPGELLDEVRAQLPGFMDLPLLAPPPELPVAPEAPPTP
jgi:hypothetical protein